MDLHLPYPLQKSRKGEFTTLASGPRGPEDYGDQPGEPTGPPRALQIISLAPGLWGVFTADDLGLTKLA